MTNDILQKELDYLLTLAMKKCDSVSDAEDITQETVLAFLAFVKRGEIPSNPRAWLISVLNRKFNDLLRRKYRLPTVTLRADFDVLSEQPADDGLVAKEEAEALRREVSQLAHLYRDVIVNYYFYEKSVSDIAVELGIPIGTVKSRLDFARKQLKKWLNGMKTYTNNSYAPRSLVLGISGSLGTDDEPISLVQGDAIAQNVLILAYEKPCGITELSKALGISAAYIEPIVRKLVRGELMRQTSDGKVYTDFIIFDALDYVLHVKDAEAFVKENGESFCDAAETAILKLRSQGFCDLKLERFMLIRIAEEMLGIAKDTLFGKQVWPDRPKGGEWIAFGTVYPQNYKIPENMRGKEEYLYCGLRTLSVPNYLGKDSLLLLNYETSLFGIKKYENLDAEDPFGIDKSLVKLLYLIKHKIDPKTVDFDFKVLKNMEVLKQNGYLRENGGELEAAIPCLTRKEHSALDGIVKSAAAVAAEKLMPQLAKYYKTYKKSVPAHLKNISEQKRIMPYEPNAMMFVFGAIERGVHPRDLGCSCPETVAVFD